MNRRIVELVESKSRRKRLFGIRPPPEKMQKILRECGKREFGVSNRAFRGYEDVVRYRNNLAHYKPQLFFHDDERPPKLPDELGLIPREAKRAVRIAEDIIEALSERLGVAVPSWVRRNVDHFFALV